MIFIWNGFKDFFSWQKPSQEELEALGEIVGMIISLFSFAVIIGLIEKLIN